MSLVPKKSKFDDAIRFKHVVATTKPTSPLLNRGEEENHGSVYRPKTVNDILRRVDKDIENVLSDTAVWLLEHQGMSENHRIKNEDEEEGEVDSTVVIGAAPRDYDHQVYSYKGTIATSSFCYPPRQRD